jgi:hypothetical protein
VNVRLTATIALAAAAAAALAAAPADAAVKKKPKPIKGSYTVTLPPDPTKEATSTAGQDGCSGLLPVSKDSHAFTAPAAGTIKVTLAGQTPDGKPSAALLDWDLYLMQDGGVEAASDGATSFEEVFLKVKKKTAFTFDVCNLDGLPSATINYVFTYK